MKIPHELDLTVSDPWDFGTEQGCGPFRVVVLKEGEMGVLIKFPYEFWFDGKKCLFFVVSPRYYEEISEQLQTKGKITVNICHVPYNNPNEIENFTFSMQTSLWGIGTIYLDYLITMEKNRSDNERKKWWEKFLRR